MKSIIARFRPTLRRRIILSLVLFALTICALGALSYSDMRIIEEKLSFVQLSGDLANVLLESRRYEKNYLLYGDAADLRETLRYLDTARDKLEDIAPEFGELKGATRLEELSGNLSEYRAALDALAALPVGAEVPDADMAALRERGKAVVDTAETLVAFERAQVYLMLDALKIRLVVSLVAVLIIGPVVAFMMFRKVLAVLGVIRQTTEQIAAGRFQAIAVPAMADEVEQAVSAFNRMVAELEKRQEQLVQARKLSSIGTLAAGIAHQLNNPLNNISTSTQIAQEELGQADQAFIARMLGNVEQEAMRARDIVKGLLEFSRERDFTTAPVALKGLAERTVQLVSSQVPPHVKVGVDVPGDIVCMVDARRIQEVLLNLVLNAVEAIGADGGRVVIAAAPDPDGANCLLSVSDSGPGIPRESLDRIFDPFYTTKDGRGGSGTGLGLSIAYGIVEKHGGSIRVTSEPGQGATFLIRLPLAPAEASPMPGPAGKGDYLHVERAAPQHDATQAPNTGRDGDDA